MSIQGCWSSTVATHDNVGRRVVVICAVDAEDDDAGVCEDDDDSNSMDAIASF